MEVILLGIGYIVLILFFTKAPGLFHAKKPVQTAQAVVLSRRGEMPDKSYSNFRGSHMNYYVTFSLGNETLELSASSSQYTRLIEDSSGELCWQDNKLISFKPA